MKVQQLHNPLCTHQPWAWRLLYHVSELKCYRYEKMEGQGDKVSEGERGGQIWSICSVVFLVIFALGGYLFGKLKFYACYQTETKFQDMVPK